jgi:predicted ATP-dependent protease
VVQSVGGVSEKVEGFFSICDKLGLSGSQGVIVPHRNIGNLILSKKVEKAVTEGRFHIFAIDTIDQALEILTGKPAGQEDHNGNFPETSVNGLVSRELRRMADIVHRYET